MIGDYKNFTCLCSKANWLNFLIFWIICWGFFKSCLWIIYNWYNFGQKAKIGNNISMLDPKIIQKPIKFNNIRYYNTSLINSILIDFWFISEDPILLILSKHIFCYTLYRHSSWRKICLNMSILFRYIIDKQWMIWIMHQLFVWVDSVL